MCLPRGRSKILQEPSHERTDRFLVTTALEDTWPSHDHPVLFLGQWCLLHDQKDKWDKFDTVLAPYHWDDREKLRKDYDYLCSVYESFLNILSSKLNEIHNVNHSLRYWRILIGPWLFYFIQSIYDRWVMLQIAQRDFDISGVKVISRRNHETVPNDMAEFQVWLVTDNWNEAIYGQILELMSIPIEMVKRSLQYRSTYNVRLKDNFRANLRGCFDLISRIFSRKTDYFFLSPYLGIGRCISLQIGLRQFPGIWQSHSLPRFAPLQDARKRWFLESPIFSQSQGFVAALCKLIPPNIPTVYLEGYQCLVKITESLKWPKRPKAIYTAHAHVSDEVFKAWAAAKTDDGAPLIIGQHGGGYGTGSFFLNETHEIAIADKFMTWGWSTPDEKTYPLGMAKPNSLSYSHLNDHDKLLLITNILPRYSYKLYSEPIAGQWELYLEDVFAFIDNLDKSLKEHLIIKNQLVDYGRNLHVRLRKRYPDLIIEAGVNIMEYGRKCKLFVSTVNSTTLLESMAANLPTVVFFNTKFYELREAAKPHFNSLKSVGIFHESPQTAAIHISKIWNNVSSWWESASVQEVRFNFCKNYAVTHFDLVDRLKRILLEENERQSVVALDSNPSNNIS